MNWTQDQLLAALHLYLQLPFGQLHQRQPRIVQLARWMGRTPGSVAMKLTNLASLDPAITASGRSGLTGASSLDRTVWAALTHDWSAISDQAAVAYTRYAASEGMSAVAADAITPAEWSAVAHDEPWPEGREREAVVKLRVDQVRFRRWVLASYGGRCCVTGLQEPSLLIASHIVPWADDPAQRLNPHNGLCLSPLYDRAFDRGLFTVTPRSLTIRVARRLREATSDPYVQETLVALDGQTLRAPERFRPDDDLLARHQERFAAHML